MPPRLSITSIGLSPRVRGNLSTDGSDMYSTGSIPACAGEPCVSVCKVDHVRVYPRVCGGTSWAAWRRLPWAGLSPRVRGNLP